VSGCADILFYVQHLLGIGHLRRSAAIVRALGATGAKVVFVSGGLPVSGLDVGSARLVQLPPLQSVDEHFSGLADQDGRAVDDAWKEARTAQLLATFEAARPRLLVTEMFPLGRRQMRFELLPLLEAAARRRPRPIIVCSVRDILNRSASTAKTQWMVATLDRYYDRVLIHGDPAVAPLDLSFPEIAGVRPEVSYTGYVVSASPGPGTDSTRGAADGEVLVSAGGGRVAAPLIEAALAARPLGPLGAAPWRILVGDHFPAPAFDGLVRRVPAGVAIERSRPDFQALLARCRLSISQAGYNTVLEVLRAGRPAVVVPFAGGAEIEQSLRADLLAARDLLCVVPEAELSGASLDRGLRRALAGTRPTTPPPIDMNGAEQTAGILSRLLAGPAS
jgi:predicted glycosyltransferase